MKKTISLLAVVFSITAFLSSLAVVSLTSSILISNASALSFESEQGLVFTLNPTVTISISGGTGSGNDGLTINNLSPGDYKDSNIITVTASSNTPRGYTLSSSVGSSTYAYTDLRVSTSDNTNIFTNLSGNVSSLANFDAGTWGYSYSTDSGSTWISGDITVTDPSSPLYPTAGYNGLPIYTTANPITLINSSSPSESSIQFKIGASANTSQLAGTYTNVVNFIGVGKIVTTNYTINYNDPSGEATSGTIPSQQTGTDTTGNAAIQISSTVPVRANYFFKGWCTVSTSDDTCSGDTIQPGGYLALNPGTSSATATVTKDLYAMWQSNLPMQNLDPTLCTSTPKTVVDVRDNKTYAIAKLADNNCWMLENLRLDPTTVSLADLKSNTNASDTTLEYLKNGGGTTSDQYPTAAVGYGDSSNYYSVPKVSVSGTCYNAYCVDSPSSGQWNSEVVTPATINGVTSIAQGKIGVYYNYCAASAGSYCWGNGTASTGSPESDPNPGSIRDVTEDLCPAGWHMPTSTANSEYESLYAAYGSDYTAFQTALNTPLSGLFNSGTARSQGSLGYFWSSTWSNTYNMRYLYVYSSGIFPSYDIYRGVGPSMRCSLDN